jgi:cysteinyl-tRNA synthetase
LLLSTHYRTQLNFTFDGLDGARSALKRIKELLYRLSEIDSKVDLPITQTLNQANEKFRAALGDDLNTSAALAVVFDLVRELNTMIDQNKLGKESAALALHLFHKWDQVLCVFPFPESLLIPEALLRLLDAREEARRSKNFALSDQIRQQILSSGYLIEDTLYGPRLKKGGS